MPETKKQVEAIKEMPAKRVFRCVSASDCLSLPEITKDPNGYKLIALAMDSSRQKP